MQHEDPWFESVWEQFFCCFFLEDSTSPYSLGQNILVLNLGELHYPRMLLRMAIQIRLSHTMFPYQVLLERDFDHT